eukprot:Filipodium_phascolosomae@DN5623_c0_g1_i1.p1
MSGIIHQAVAMKNETGVMVVARRQRIAVILLLGMMGYTYILEAMVAQGGGGGECDSGMCRLLPLLPVVVVAAAEVVEEIPAISKVKFEPLDLRMAMSDNFTMTFEVDGINTTNPIPENSILTITTTAGMDGTSFVCNPPWDTSAVKTCLPNKLTLNKITTSKIVIHGLFQNPQSLRLTTISGGDRINVTLTMPKGTKTTKNGQGAQIPAFTPANLRPRLDCDNWSTGSQGVVCWIQFRSEVMLPIGAFVFVKSVWPSGITFRDDCHYWISQGVECKDNAAKYCKAVKGVDGGAVLALRHQCRADSNCKVYFKLKWPRPAGVGLVKMDARVYVKGSDIYNSTASTARSSRNTTTAYKTSYSGSAAMERMFVNLFFTTAATTPTPAPPAEGTLGIPLVESYCLIDGRELSALGPTRGPVCQ